jgi:c(7)-type cytochrome triheme protein
MFTEKHLAALIVFITSCLAGVSCLADGKAVSDAYCGACHIAGVIGAPRIGVKADWEYRLEQGRDVLVDHAVNGFKNMPPKGGNILLTTDEVAQAVEYMLHEAELNENPPADIAVGAPKIKNEETIQAERKEREMTRKVKSANSFNRLMKSREEWNPHPSDDGIHDAENPATYSLQPPREAFESLPKNPDGNHVDWVKALDAGLIQPRFDAYDADKQPLVMDLDIVREVKGSMPDVVYPHKQHTQWLDCVNCHPAIFIPQKGANALSMASILLGEQCGVCHGQVAFPISECTRCHSRPKQQSAER